MRESRLECLACTTADLVETTGWPQETTPASSTDAEAIDYLLFVHDSHDGKLAAAHRYLEWELVPAARCTPGELLGVDVLERKNGYR